MLNRVPKSQFCGTQKHAIQAVKVVEKLGFGYSIWLVQEVLNATNRNGTWPEGASHTVA